MLTNSKIKHICDELRKNDCLINYYNNFDILLENPKHPNHFISLKIIDDHYYSSIYLKQSCFSKKRLTNERQLSSIAELLKFANNPVFEKYASPDARVYITDSCIYARELFRVSYYPYISGAYDRLIQDQANARQHRILEKVQHIEMLPSDSDEHTVLRFSNNRAYFDYHCQSETIIGEGLLPIEPLENTDSAYDTNDDPFEVLPHDAKFRYQLLGRTQSDCDYYLQNTRNTNYLWAKSEIDQIKTMKLLYDSFPTNQKPEWLTPNQINEYAIQMGVTESEKKND